jgi:NADH:ubiquinone oxidoreductase subunit E
MVSEAECKCREMNAAEKFSLLHDVICEYDRRESNLIQVLHLAQAIFGYLPKDVLSYIAGEMNLSLSKVNGVVSFYSFFTTQPQGRHTIQVCLGTACYVRGGKKIVDKIKELLKVDVGGTTADRRFTFVVMRCIGACGLAPAISIDGTVHKRVNPNKLQGILDHYR